MHPNRRRKKRPNYGIRTAEVMRGPNGFGFTISGQQPCILSCIVANSPADQAGLRAGDFLISVNGMSVSKSTHDAVVNLIGNSVGPIRMTIAENYYSDSSDEENDIPRLVSNRKPRHLHRPRGHRNNKSDDLKLNSPLKKLSKISDSGIKTQQGHSYVNENSSYYNNSNAGYVENVNTPRQQLVVEETEGLVEYKVLVGYLGTIEMPKQLLPNSRLQTVCSCIRKLRQEKRSPTFILMTILSTCLTLKNASNQILAIYPSNRVIYISSMADKDTRYFGLVTSAVCNTNSTETVNEDPSWDSKTSANATSSNRNDIEISNSCHVFLADPKLGDHNLHLQKAKQFKISCTKDVITGGCLEFPRSALYIVSLVQNIYKLQDSVSERNNAFLNGQLRHNNGHLNDDLLLVVANSPQPSASSNSDSGIGYRDDCGNVSDRILIVEFPVQKKLHLTNNCTHGRPSGIDASSIPLENLDVPLNNENSFVSQTRNTADIDTIRCTNNIEVRCSKNVNEDAQAVEQREEGEPFKPNLNNIRALDNGFSRKQNCTNVHKSSNVANDQSPIYHEIENIYQKFTGENDYDYEMVNRFSVRAMPNPRNNYSGNNLETYSERAVDVPNSKKSYESVSSHSVNEDLSSVENMSVHSLKGAENVFKVPNALYFENKVTSKRQLKVVGSYDNLTSDKYANSLLKYKLSPKVYGISKPNYSCEELSKLEPVEMCGYSSLQNLCSWTNESDSKKIVTQSEPDVRLECTTNDDENGLRNSEGPSVWASSFEKLLEDPVGLQTFAAFLKKEFSAENIYFWTACERYRRIPSVAERVVEAQKIYKRHLCTGAPEPVNVDSQGRQITEQSLQEANCCLFGQAQKQIFNLMKFDSYPRFLKSELYKQCLAGNSESHFDASLLIYPSSATPTKLKKSLSNAEDRRRKSLLPWHRKCRSKSKDRGETEYNQSKKDGANGSDQSEIHSSKSSLLSQESGKLFPDDANITGRNPLCRVILSNGITTVVQIKQEEIIEELVNRVLEKRGITYSSYEVLTDKHSKPLDIQESSALLAGCEVRIEQRVVFKIYLPNKKVIAVKSKYTKILVDVLKPILNKYDYKLEQVTVNIGNDPVDVFQPVTAIEGMRLNIQLKNGHPRDNLQKVLSKPCITLDSVTNRVFKDILNEKVESKFSKTKSDQGSIKSDGWDSEHSSGIFGKLLKKDSGAGYEKKKKPNPLRSKTDSTHSSCEDVCSEQNNPIKKPLIAKWKTGAKLHLPSPESDELYEGLKRAQRSRLEDQRGTEINFELPDFLKDKNCSDMNYSKTTEDRFRPNQQVKLNGMDDNSHYHFNNSFFNNNKLNNFRIYSPNKLSPSANINKFENSTSPLKCNNEKVAEASEKIGNNESFGRPSEPPPLPPKPKILPTKPSNWGQNGMMMKYAQRPSPEGPTSSLYLEQPTSSFV